MPKTDPIEIDKRVRQVMEWLIEDFPYDDIVTQIVVKWGVCDRQAKRYIATARDRWGKAEQGLIDQKRRLKIASLKKLKRSLKDSHKGTPGGIRAILQVEREIIKLEGLNPALKLELTGKDGEPIQTRNVNVNMTAEEVKAIAKQLEEEF